MSLIVFDLECARGHVFEAWFRGAQAFQDQVDRGLLSCPVCGDTTIKRKLSAPRLNLGKGSQDADANARGRAAVQMLPDTLAGATPGKSDAPNPADQQAMMAPSAAQLARFQAEVLRHMRDVVSSAENVGDRFATEALKMHQGDAKERAIRGTATPQEQRQLAEEGISFMAVPEFLDEDKLQ